MTRNTFTHSISFGCYTNKLNPSNIIISTFTFLSLSLSPCLLSCLIFWPLSAICASATFGTSPPTGTCAKPGNPNQDALLGSVQLTRLGNCTLTLIFMAGPLFIFILCVFCLMSFLWLETRFCLQHFQQGFSCSYWPILYIVSLKYPINYVV